MTQDERTLAVYAVAGQLAMRGLCREDAIEMAERLFDAVLEAETKRAMAALQNLTGELK